MKRLILATALLALAACAQPPGAPAPTNVTDQPCVRTADHDCVERYDDGTAK